MESIVRDLSLKDKGLLKIEWAENFMHVLGEIRKRFEEEKPLKGVTIGMALHLEAKTAVLVKTLVAGGARVAITSCNPESTQDDVAAALTNWAKVYAWRGETVEEYYENLRRVLDNNPQIIVDDGADLIVLLHRERPDLLKDIIGGTEETTTGVIRLKNMEREGVLKFPVIAVNNAYMKYLFDNRYGTGESAIFGILNATNLTLAGKNVVVCGYGWCGRGIAMRARGMGAKVIVTEVNPIRAVEAIMDGFEVMKLIDAVKKADIVITATGVKKVVRKEHFLVAKDKCIFANAGHFDVEIWKPDLEEISVSKKKTRYFGLPWEDYLVEEYTLKNGKKLYLLAKGRLVNLVAGQGHATEIMDLSFSLQALSIEHLVKKAGTLENKVYNVPREIDEEVARLKLRTLGVEIDSLTEEQKEYLKSFELGT
ncbi:MAG: adenosylhomocysteinase [Candidatus Njordarchaeales archaeon]